MTQSLAQFHQEECLKGGILDSTRTIRVSMVMDQLISEVARLEAVDRSTLVRAAIHAFLEAKGLNPRLPMSLQPQAAHRQ